MDFWLSLVHLKVASFSESAWIQLPGSFFKLRSKQRTIQLVTGVHNNSFLLTLFPFVFSCFVDFHRRVHHGNDPETDGPRGQGVREEPMELF